MSITEFTLQTSAQLPILLRAFRKEAGLTQAAAALRLGISQQSMSAMERNADKVSADRLLQLLRILGVELVLRQGAGSPIPASVSEPQW